MVWETIGSRRARASHRTPGGKEPVLRGSATVRRPRRLVRVILRFVADVVVLLLLRVTVGLPLVSMFRFE